MTRRMLRARLRARVSDERGFTLLETIIAVTVMFGSLLALAYTATIGFGYQSLSRQKQTANGIANQVMEDIRGLAYEKITTGLLTSDLSGDSNIVTCSGISRFLACTASASVPGQGEKIVTSTTAVNPTVPLVPHRSVTAGSSPVIDGTTYQWSTYVTRNDAVTSAPYRVTVLVTWSGGTMNAPNKLVKVQSLFWSPSGCRSTSTHPFAAPCQPFFFATTDVPQATIELTGTVDQIGTVEAALYGPVSSASVQQEQVSQAQASWQAAEVELTAAGATTIAGGTTKATNVDNDPSSTTGTYQRWRCPTDVTCATGSATSTNSGNTITLTAGSTTTEADSTTAANNSTAVCPPPTATAENDGLLCSGTRVQQTGALTAVLSLQHSTNIGSATIAQVQAAGSATTSSVQRNIHPNTNGCSPTSTADGCVGLSVSRTQGTINIGGLPSAFAAGTGWTGAAAYNGYFLSVVGYTDSLTAAVGTNASAPAAAQSGTIYYYNGTGYTSLSATSSSLNALNQSYSTTQTISGTAYTLTISTVTTGMAAGSTSLSPASCASSTCTDVTSRVTPPAVSVTYSLSGGGTSASFTVNVLLGTLEANGSYAAAPASGT